MQTQGEGGSVTTEWNLITVGEGAGEGAQPRPIISKATAPRSLGKAVCNLVPRPAQLPASSPVSYSTSTYLCRLRWRALRSRRQEGQTQEA